MKRIALVTCILTGMLFHAFSQDYNLRVLKFEPGEKADKAPDLLIKDVFDLSAPYGAIVSEKQNKEQGGKKIYRLQQTYAGIPIDHAVALIHVENGFIKRIITNWPEAPVNIPVVPGITVEKAQKTVLDAVEENGALLEKNKEGGQTPLRLQYASGHWILVYEFFVEIPSPYDVRRVLVNARSGAIISNESTGHSCCTPATATLNYRGTETILTDPFNSGQFRLRACIGQNGGGDCNAPIGNFRTVQNHNLLDFTNGSTDWTGFAIDTRERCALDAHWGTQAVSDYYLNGSTMNENIFYGEEMINVIHAGLTNNAVYHAGSNRISYGHTPGTQRYLTALDIVAHELTHQVTFYNSGLIYQGEPGAINEAISDIYAMAVEAHYSSLDWLIGDDITTLRSFIDPNAFDQADTYNGFNWANGTADQGGVHTNSGVINYWFYLLVNGGVGTNDLGNAYNVNGIGLANAMALMDALQGGFITPTTTMHELRELALIAAGELWWYCSDNYMAVAEAFYAVGIGEPFSAHTPIDETWETDITSCSARLHWEDVVAEQYLITIWPANNPGNVIYEHALINEVTVHNLVPNTVYEWAVVAQCEDYLIGTEHMDTFTTTDVCPALKDLTVSNITTCSAELSWVYNSAGLFRIDYWEFGSNQVLTEFATESPFVLNNNLVDNTHYIVVVTPLCGDQCVGVSDSLQFMTTGCELSNLKIDNTPCYFTINWDMQEGQTYWIESSFIDPNLPGHIFPLQNVGDFFGSYSFLHSFLPGTIIMVDITISCTGDGCFNDNVVHFEFTVPEPTDACDAPSNITVQYTEGGGRIISWDGPENGTGNYNVVIVSDDGTVESENNYYGNKMVSGGGGPNQCITIQVQAICGCDGNTTTSEWAEQVVCPPCEPPVEMHLEYLCSDFAGFEFTGPFNGLGYRVRFWPVSDPLDVTTLPELLDYFTFFQLDNLIPNTSYVVELTTLCGGGEESSSIYATFTTDPEICAVPSNLTYQLLGNGVVRLDWAASPGADYYEVQYRQGASSPWTTVQVFNNYLEITGLLLDGCFFYTARVRAICGECWYGVSAYSPLFNFPDCMPPGIHIGLEAGQLCDPCFSDCYVCIVDEHGNKINTTANGGSYWYSIYWSVPQSYPIPSSHLTNRECINMSPSNQGQVFQAFVRKICTIEGVPSVVCQTTLIYEHVCSEVEGDNGGTIIGGGGLADGTNKEALVPMAVETSFSLYPNPGDRSFNLVNRSETDYQAVIMDAYGRSLYTTFSGAGETSVIEAIDWPSGVYYIRMKTSEGSGIATLKWVKL